MINNEITLLSKRIIYDRGEPEEVYSNPFGDTKFQLGANFAKSISNIQEQKPLKHVSTASMKQSSKLKSNRYGSDCSQLSQLRQLREQYTQQKQQKPDYGDDYQKRMSQFVDEFTIDTRLEQLKQLSHRRFISWHKSRNQSKQASEGELMPIIVQPSRNADCSLLPQINQSHKQLDSAAGQLISVNRRNDSQESLKIEIIKERRLLHESQGVISRSPELISSQIDLQPHSSTIRRKIPKKIPQRHHYKLDQILSQRQKVKNINPKQEKDFAHLKKKKFKDSPLIAAIQQEGPIKVDKAQSFSLEGWQEYDEDLNNIFL